MYKLGLISTILVIMSINTYAENFLKSENIPENPEKTFENPENPEILRSYD